MRQSLPHSKPAVLVTGGAGFIGSHTAKALGLAGYLPVVFDNLSHGHREAVQWGPFVHGDVRDSQGLLDVMRSYDVAAVIHFAGLIEVGRSTARPDLFYEQNVTGTAAVLAAMRRAEVTRLIFSSSAAVYAAPLTGERLTEEHPTVPISPYGDTKLAAERMIAAHCAAFGLQGLALRYFNAAGADPEGELGEAHDPETHLIPLAVKTGLGLIPELKVFGDDFPTADGTCVRDYIHVSDLALAHVAAVDAELDRSSFIALNVGVGVGYSVREVLLAVDRVLGVRTPHTIVARRAGDPATLVADPRRAERIIEWSAQERDLDEIVRDAAVWFEGGFRKPLAGFPQSDYETLQEPMKLIGERPSLAPT